MDVRGGDRVVFLGAVQHDFIAHRGAGDVGDVDDARVHRQQVDHGRAGAADEDPRRTPEVSVVAVGIPDGYDSEA